MKTRAVAVITVALTAAAANADTVNVQYLGTGEGRNVFAGQLQHSLTGGTGTVGSTLNGIQNTYCTDLTQYVTGGGSLYQVVGVPSMPAPAMGPDKAQAIYDIYSGAAGQQALVGVSDDYAAAFQIAVWEIVHDYNSGSGLASIDVTAGTLRITRMDGSALSAGVMSALTGILSSVGINAVNPNLYGVANDNHQDQLVTGPVVPLPSAGFLASAGLLAIGARRRNR